MVTIGEELRFRRLLTGLKQFQVAAAVGITQAALCQFEMERRQPSAEMVERIRQAIEKLADKEVMEGRQLKKRIYQVTQ
jgi:transcriptional regulator with XRE-family HTH domain